jgi:8-oxo-dGTP pyrophosphatase MutT (NUDIX family)
MLPKCFYRVSTKALIVKEDKVLLIMESDGRWELPGGGLEVGESFESGIKREVHEELGVNVTEISPQPLYIWTLVDDDSQKGLTPKVILCFKVKIDSFNFKGDPEESVKMNFFSKDEIASLNLHPNIKELSNLLDQSGLKENQ